MAYRHTVISNLKYIDEVFHNIAHNIPHPNEQGYEGHDDNTLQKWECVDDRFSTGFGSTYEVPVNDFPTRDEVVVITIFGDTWLHVETVAYEEHYFSRWESVEDTEKISRVPYKESLPEVLERVYPNGTVNLVGDFSSSATTEIDLDDVWNYLQGLSTYPDYFIFNGASLTQANNGKAYTIQRIKDIDNFCKQNKIKACCVFTENRHLEGIDNKDWAEVFSTTTKMLKFSTLDWATHHLSLIETNYAVYENETKLDALFGVKDLTVRAYALSLYMTKKNLDNEVECYEELIYTVIKRFILEQLFALHRECFYITLMYKSVQGELNGSTYDFYYGTQFKPYNLLAGFTYSDVGIELSDKPLLIGHHQTKYGTDHHWNLFKNTGQLVAICLHTDFSEHLWACQQGQSSCYQEFLSMRPHNPANLMLERTYVTGDREYESGRVVPALFQGTGCSWFTISQQNREDYKNKLGYACPIDIWIARDNYTSSITISLHTEIGKPTLYQSIELGKMSSIETENYIYPLYVGGGSIGLSSDIYVYYPITGGDKTYIAGNVYDLDMNNICLSNTNILHPACFWNSTFTNFKILTPEGMWRAVQCHRQDASVVPYPSLGPPPDYAVHLNPPTHNDGPNGACAFPFLMQNWNSIGSQHIKNRNWLPKEPVDNKVCEFTSRFDSIRVAIKAFQSNWHEQGINYGAIPHCWRTWDKEIPSGEFTVNGKKYLAVPCGWDGRLWDYGWHLNIYNNTWEAVDVVNEFEKYYYSQNARIEDKLIIELGDIDV